MINLDLRLFLLNDFLDKEISFIVDAYPNFPAMLNYDHTFGELYLVLKAQVFKEYIIYGNR